jgi:hypothetical protein
MLLKRLHFYASFDVVIKSTWCQILQTNGTLDGCNFSQLAWIINIIV